MATILVSAHDVAAATVRRYPSGISSSKLHKLMFLTQAWHLALVDTPIFEDDFVPASTGPRLPVLMPLHEDMTTIHSWPKGDPDELRLPHQTSHNTVINQYGALSGPQLMEHPHVKSELWALARADDQAMIEKSEIRAYFKRVLMGDRYDFPPMRIPNTETLVTKGR